MPASPVRLAIASPDEAVAVSLRRLLAQHTDRVLVVDDVDVDTVDVVLQDVDHPEGAADVSASLGGVAVRLPLRAAIEEIVELVEAAARLQTTTTEEFGLSARETEVLALIAQGLTNQEIADRVFVSINSVKTYIRSAYRKIGVKSRSQAAVWGMRHGIVGSRGRP